MIQVGAATKVINNELGTLIQGASVDNRAESIRDDLEANALYLSDGGTSILLVSCDLAGLLPENAAAAREAMAAACGVPPRNIIIAGTHTHTGPSLVPTNYFKPLDEAYLARLQEWLVELSTDAVGSMRPARIGWGLGEARLGYNRRCCWADGSHTMHGDATRGDFAGLEGPDDPAHLALFARDDDGKFIAVLHNNTSHPTCFYGRNFYSADFPGSARAYLREALGPIPVLYLNGAFGDIGNESQLTGRHNRESAEQKVLRLGHLAAGETLRLLQEATFREVALLAHAHEDLEVGVRLPHPDRLAWARETLAEVDAGGEVKAWDRMLAYGVVLLQENFGERPFDTVPVHAIRIGDVALVTQPCELYCRFGLDIKRRSPAPLTGVVGIADGYNGYCPTVYGILGGGYSGEPINWSRLAANAGYRIVDTAAKLLHQLWRR